MTTRLQQQHKQAVLFCCYLFALPTFLGLVASALEIVNHPVGLDILWSVFLLSTTIVWIFMNNRKYPVELTEEERRMPVEARADYSNRMNWKLLILVVVYLVYAILVTGFLPLYAKYIVNGDWSCLWSRLSKLLCALPVSWWVLVGITMVLPVYILYRRSANIYLLEGDTLIIRERNLLKWEDELRIPVASISKLYIKNRWSLRPFLYMEVDGVPRSLQANTHVTELAVGILLRQ
ncbi:MAG: hypothetical protein IJT12_08290 [Paludibacteraceae bacterium]|nr:hypothetical protein [Paludibacteraceae bacterium]